MKILNQIKTYDPDYSTKADYELEVYDTGINFSLVDDYIVLPNGSLTKALTPRTVKIELRPDGGINVLLYRQEQDEPNHYVLMTNGVLGIIA